MITINSTGAAVTAAFTAAMQSGYRIATRAELWSTGSTPKQLLSTPLTISSGRVTIDRQGQQRRRCHLTIEVTPGSTLIPSSASSASAPFGNEIKLFFGVTYTSGSTELVPLGVFPFVTTNVSDDGRRIDVTVDGFDRSWVVSNLKFTTPYTVASGTDVATAIRSLLNTVCTTVYPTLTYNITPTTGYTTPAAVFAEGSDPWAAALSLAQSAGYEMFFDASGVCVGRPVADPTITPTSWNYAEGTTTPMPSPNTVPLAFTRTMTRDGIKNDFTVSGTGTGNTSAGPVRANAKDTTDGSATNANGPFGDVPTFITSNLVTTTSAASQAATTALRQSLADADRVSVAAIPNPLLDVGDVLGIARSRIYLSGRMVVDSIEHAFRHDDVMTIKGRKVA